MSRSAYQLNTDWLAKLVRLVNPPPDADERDVARQLVSWVAEETGAAGALLAEQHSPHRPYQIGVCLFDGQWHAPFDLGPTTLAFEDDNDGEVDPTSSESQAEGELFQGDFDNIRLPFAASRFLAVRFRPKGIATVVMVLDPLPSVACESVVQVAGSLWAQRLRQNAERAEFARRERNLTQALAANSAGYWEADMMTGELRTVGFQQLLGFDDEEMPKTLGEWHARIHPEDLPRIRAAHRDYPDQFPPKFDCVFRVKNSQGEWVRMRGRGRATMQLNPSEPPLRMAGFDADVSKMQPSANEDRLAEEVLQQLDIAVIRIEAQGRIVGSNSAAAVQLGYSMDELSNLNYSDLTPHSEECQWQEIWSATQNSLWENEWLMRAADGSTFTAEVKITRIAQMPTIACMAFFKTAHRKSQQQAEWTQRQALTEASRLQTMGELVGAIAHEMTQPLSAISNFASACRTRLKQGRDARDPATLTAEMAQQLLSWIDSVIDQSHRAGAIIDRLRQFSRRSAPHRSTFDLNKVLEESIQLHVGEAYSEEVKIRAKLEPGSPQVIIDEVQLHQVMANLIRNAFEATESNADERWVVVQSEIRENEVIVTIEDNGCGISASIADKIYEPFETTRSDRMGVGLAIARSIIEAHHGRLWHADNPTGGVSFSFSVPLVKRGVDQS